MQTDKLMFKYTARQSDRKTVRIADRLKVSWVNMLTVWQTDTMTDRWMH
jgi:hypothetical protein